MPAALPAARAQRVCNDELCFSRACPGSKAEAQRSVSGAVRARPGRQACNTRARECRYDRQRWLLRRSRGIRDQPGSHDDAAHAFEELIVTRC